MFDKTRVTVLGGGSWATAIVKMLMNNVDSLTWYMRSVETIEYIKKHRHNPRYLSAVTFDIRKLKLTTDINEAVKNSNLIIFAIPAAFCKDALEELRYPLDKKKVVSAIKGIIPEENMILGEYFNKIHNVPLDQIAAISGPCHAEEVVLERLSYLTISSTNLKLAKQVADLLVCRYIKASISDDIYGCEYASVLKNIFSIAAGVCNSLGYGDNFQAVLISNGIQEIKRFVDQVHPIYRDIDASVYLGDLLVTAYSQFSRNRTFGAMVGKGYSVKSAQLEMNMVAEGYFATNCINQINKKYKVDMPITTAIYNILYNGVSPALEIKLLTEKMK